MTKHKLLLADMVVKAEDCYDPTDYVLVHRDHLAKLRELLRRVIEWSPALPAEASLIDEIGDMLKGPTHQVGEQRG